MRAVISLLILGLVAIAIGPVSSTITIVSEYPSIAAVLYSSTGDFFTQSCGGTIVTTKSILTAAHCIYGDSDVSHWRVRVGSSWANNDGTIYPLNSIIVHPDFMVRTFNNDIAILRTYRPITFSNVVKPASIAGATYNLPDSQVVWALRWGTTTTSDVLSKQLRRIQIWTINQAECAYRYTMLGSNITANMLCAGWHGAGSRDECQGDPGTPLYHNGIMVGIQSWSYGCTDVMYPTVYTRISSVVTWIQSNV